VRHFGPLVARRATSTAAYFGFVQWELAGWLGPDPGRYVVRRYAGDNAQQVVVISGLEAPRRRRFGGRRARAAEPDAAPVEVVRATVVGADPYDGDDAAEAWLAGALTDATVAAALSVLNRALHARRIATADPYAGELAPHHALVTRVGYGTGEQVSEGGWTVARELPPPPAAPAREAALRPQERFAALLAARDAPLACELLALRARLDLDHGREREAALQLEAALAVAASELESWRELEGMPARLEELAALAPGAAAAAVAARAGGLDESTRAAVAHALGRLEAALRARTASAVF
jgi:hypothetical protein